MFDLFSGNVQDETEEFKNGDKRLEVLNTFKNKCVEMFNNVVQNKYVFRCIDNLFTENSIYPNHPLADLDENLKRKYFNLLADFYEPFNGSNFLHKLNHGLGLNDSNISLKVMPIEEVDEIMKVVIEKGMQPVLIFEFLALWSMKIKHHMDFSWRKDIVFHDFGKSPDELGSYINDIVLKFDMTADELKNLCDFTLAFISGNNTMYTQYPDALTCYAEHIRNPITESFFSDFPENFFDE